MNQQSLLIVNKLMENPTNKFGIRITLPEGSTIGMEYLLSEDWGYFRWFSSAEKRDSAFADMQRQPRNYRNRKYDQTEFTKDG